MRVYGRRQRVVDDERGRRLGYVYCRPPAATTCAAGDEQLYRLDRLPDARTGKRIWHFQTVTTTCSTMTTRRRQSLWTSAWMAADQGPRQVTKRGLVFVLDRVTGAGLADRRAARS
jgi:hypothetical protein